MPCGKRGREREEQEDQRQQPKYKESGYPNSWILERKKNQPSPLLVLKNSG